MRVEDELAKAKALVGGAVKAEAKKQRKGLLNSIMAKRREMMNVRTARKKLRVELGKELKAKVWALKKASVMCTLSMPVLLAQSLYKHYMGIILKKNLIPSVVTILWLKTARESHILNITIAQRKITTTSYAFGQMFSSSVQNF